MGTHANLTGTDLHEPKGIASASSGTYYKANGSGSGTWVKPKHTDLDSGSSTSGQVLLSTGSGGSAWSTVNNSNLMHYTVHLADIGQASSTFLYFPLAGQVTKVDSVIHATLTVADCAIVCKKNGTPLTSGSFTIAYTGSAAGDHDSCTPTSATFSAGEILEINSDGAGTGVTPATFIVTYALS